MDYEMEQAQFERVVSLPAKERYMYFLCKVTEEQELWTLKSPEGFVMFTDESGRESVPVWPHPEYAAALASDSWADCSLEKIELSLFLSRWIPDMRKDSLMVAVFPIPEEKGIVVDPRWLQTELAEELKHCAWETSNQVDRHAE